MLLDNGRQKDKGTPLWMTKRLDGSTNVIIETDSDVIVAFVGCSI